MGRNKRHVNITSRKKKSRYTGDTVLIVCEGKETEPNYLEELKHHFALNQAAVVVDPTSGSAPNSVVKHAKAEIKKACDAGNPYAKVYCVIDRDQHPTYTSALQTIKDFNASTRKKCDTVLCAIPSVPCFEYWILMHYVQTTKSFGTGGSSPCGQLISTELKKHIPGYEKANRALAKILIAQKLTTARVNSAVTYNAAKSAGTDDPSSKMHLLVDELEYLKQNKHFGEDRKGCPL